MRRTRQIVFFVAILACGGFLFWQRRQRQPEQPKNADGTTEQIAAAPSPHLAPGMPSQAASIIADSGPVVLDEQGLMRQIRAHVKSDPPRAEALAREGRQRFGDTPEADERDALLVDALINQQRIGAARSETYYYFDHHPGGRFAEHLFAMTGVHPRPAGPGR
jgi:hypothetical protein